MQLVTGVRKKVIKGKVLRLGICLKLEIILFASYQKPHSDIVQQLNAIVSHSRMMDDQNSLKISVDFTDAVNR